MPLRLRMAAGAQITHSRLEEVVTRNNETVLYEAGHRNGYNVNPLTSIYERASLVPAAAVIPALKMHRIIAAVKKLVVGSVPRGRFSPTGELLLRGAFGWSRFVFARRRIRASEFTLNKSECSTQASRLNVRAWNNRRGFRFYFIGFID